jgi:hypothetical protein
MTVPRGSADPVFLHALFRAGSTYLFNVFRRSGHGYYGYQEPENEFLVHLNRDPDQLLTMGADKARELRHPAGADPVYFREFYQIRESLAGLFHPSFCYEDFFIAPGDRLPPQQRVYFQTLIDQARGRPVLQFCRSAGRIRALKEDLGGIHLHLWREPRNQWWSYKVNDYFDATLHLIYNAARVPAVMAAAGEICRIPAFQGGDVFEAFAFARRHPLAPEDNYFAFYALWLYAFGEYEAWADATINIDRLSLQDAYRHEIQEGLERLGITGIDFSDCAVPRALFDTEEAEFFRKIETRVQGLFLMHGYDRRVQDKVIRDHEAVFPATAEARSDPLRDARRGRQTALRCMGEATSAFDIARDCQEQLRRRESDLAREQDRAAAAEKALAAERQRLAAVEENRGFERQRADAAEEKLRLEQDRSAAAEATLRSEQQRAREAEERYRAAHERAGLAEAISASYLKQIQALHQSRSWRLTAPLRFVSLRVSRGNLRLRTTLRTGLETGYHLLNRNPSLKQRMLRSVAVFPSLEARLRRALYRQIFGGAFRPEDPPPLRTSVSGNGPAETGAKALLDALSPRERQICRDLQNAFQSIAPEE